MTSRNYRYTAILAFVFVIPSISYPRTASTNSDEPSDLSEFLEQTDIKYVITLFMRIPHMSNDEVFHIINKCYGPLLAVHLLIVVIRAMSMIRYGNMVGI